MVHTLLRTVVVKNILSLQLFYDLCLHVISLLWYLALHTFLYLMCVCEFCTIFSTLHCVCHQILKILLIFNGLSGNFFLFHIDFWDCCQQIRFFLNGRNISTFSKVYEKKCTVKYLWCWFPITIINLI